MRHSSLLTQKVYPNVAYLRRGKTRQGAPHVALHSLGQVEAYLTVREILAEASTGADGVHWREFSGFDRFRFATLGLSYASERLYSRRDNNPL